MNEELDVNIVETGEDHVAGVHLTVVRPEVQKQGFVANQREKKKYGTDVFFEDFCSNL